VLIVGDKKAFLSMYATVSAAGMRAFQLERSDGLQGKTDDANAVIAVRSLGDYPSSTPSPWPTAPSALTLAPGRCLLCLIDLRVSTHIWRARGQAAEAAAASADFVLATHAQLRCEGFPFHCFHRVLEYVQEVRKSSVGGRSCNAGIMAAVWHIHINWWAHYCAMLCNTQSSQSTRHARSQWLQTPLDSLVRGPRRIAAQTLLPIITGKSVTAWMLRRVCSCGHRSAPPPPTRRCLRAEQYPCFASSPSSTSAGRQRPSQTEVLKRDRRSQLRHRSGVHKRTDRLAPRSGLLG